MSSAFTALTDNATASYGSTADTSTTVLPTESHDDSTHLSDSKDGEQDTSLEERDNVDSGVPSHNDGSAAPGPITPPWWWPYARKSDDEETRPRTISEILAAGDPTEDEAKMMDFIKKSRAKLEPTYRGNKDLLERWTELGVWEKKVNPDRTVVDGNGSRRSVSPEELLDIAMDNSFRVGREAQELGRSLIAQGKPATFGGMPFFSEDEKV